jgi:transmembrane sensor
VTNVVEFGGRASIEHEARKWLIRMDSGEPLTEAERRAWTEWLERSPLHQEEFTRLSQFWNAANRLAELAGNGIEPAGRVRNRPLPASSLSRILMTASAVLASTLLGWWGFRQASGTGTRAYETPVGQQKTVLLPDGSSLQLNTNTRVEVVYRHNSRIIRLTRGEAHFAAASDPSREFEVHIADTVVRASGTVFNIYVGEQTVEVIVTSGRVEVLNGKSTPETATGAADVTPDNLPDSAQLKAGEAADFHTSSGLMRVRQLAEPELRQRLAWRGGYLEFSGEALSQVVAVLNRYSTVRLEIGDPGLASVAISGRFRIGNMGAAVRLLCKTRGFRARRVGGRIRLDSTAAH